MIRPIPLVGCVESAKTHQGDCRSVGAWSPDHAPRPTSVGAWSPDHAPRPTAGLLGFCTGRPPVQPSGPVGRPAHNSATVRNRPSLRWGVVSGPRPPPLGRGLRTTPLGRPQVSLAFVQGDLRSSPVGETGP